MKWTSIDLSSKLSLTYGGNITYYKSVHHAVPTLPVGTRNTLTIFKTISKLYFQLSVQINPLLGQLKGKERHFLEGARRGTTL